MKCHTLVYFDDLTRSTSYWSWFCLKHPEVRVGIYTSRALAQIGADSHEATRATHPYEDVLDESERAGH